MEKPPDQDDGDGASTSNGDQAHDKKNSKLQKSWYEFLIASPVTKLASMMSGLKISSPKKTKVKAPESEVKNEEAEENLLNDTSSSSASTGASPNYKKEVSEAKKDDCKVEKVSWSKAKGPGGNDVDYANSDYYFYSESESEDDFIEIDTASNSEPEVEADEAPPTVAPPVSEEQRANEANTNESFEDKVEIADEVEVSTGEGDSKIEENELCTTSNDKLSKSKREDDGVNDSKTEETDPDNTCNSKDNKSRANDNNETLEEESNSGFKSTKTNEVNKTKNDTGGDADLKSETNSSSTSMNEVNGSHVDSKTEETNSNATSANDSKMEQSMNVSESELNHSTCPGCRGCDLDQSNYELLVNFTEIQTSPEQLIDLPLAEDSAQERFNPVLAMDSK